MQRVCRYVRTTVTADAQPNNEITNKYKKKKNVYLGFCRYRKRFRQFRLFFFFYFNSVVDAVVYRIEI